MKSKGVGSLPPVVIALVLVLPYILILCTASSMQAQCGTPPGELAGFDRASIEAWMNLCRSYGGTPVNLQCLNIDPNWCHRTSGADSSSSSTVTSVLAALPAATNLKQAIVFGAVQGVLNGVMSSLFSNNPQSDQQRQELEEQLEQQREETARQHALAEQKRIDEMFARLNQELKLQGLPELALKGISSSSDLQLKGLNSDDLGGGLKLKLSTDNQPTQLSDCGGRSWGIPGLPGVYLKDCHEPSLFFPNTPGAPGPVQVAQSAQNLSGSPRDTVEEAVLNTAKNDPRLMSPSPDPNVTNFQQADHAYEQAVQEQSAASQEYTLAQAKVEDDQNVLKAVSSKIDPATASAEQQAVLGQMAAAAKTDEQAAVLARQGFDSAAAKVPVVREQAVTALAAVSTPSSAVTSVDLSSAKQPLVPQLLRGQRTIGTPPVTNAEMTAGKTAEPPAPRQQIVDCPSERAAVSRLVAGRAVQEDAIEKTQKALDSAIKDIANARTDAELAGLETLNSVAIRTSAVSEQLIAREQGLKSAGIANDAAARFKFLQRLKRIAELSNDLVDATQNSEKLKQSYAAGKNFGNDKFASTTARSLSEQLQEIEKLATNSGIPQEVRDELPSEAARGLASFFFGPIGEADVDLTLSGIDLLVAGREVTDSVAAARKAERNLNLMRIQQHRIQQKISELERHVSETCPSSAGKLQ